MKRLTISFDDKQVQFIERLAKDHKRSFAFTVRDLLETGIRYHHESKRKIKATTK